MLLQSLVFHNLGVTGGSWTRYTQSHILVHQPLLPRPRLNCGYSNRGSFPWEMVSVRTTIGSNLNRFRLLRGFYIRELVCSTEPYYMVGRCGLEPLPVKVRFYRPSARTPSFTYPLTYYQPRRLICLCSSHFIPAKPEASIRRIVIICSLRC